MTHVVINADDLGITRGVNVAIERAFREGILTSASLMANMPAFQHAVEGAISRNPRLGIGVHLVLTSGPSVSRPELVPLLVDRRGSFRHGFVGIRRLVRGPHASTALQAIDRELRAQCEKVLRHGIRFDHLDGHRYIHMIPEVWTIVVRLALEYGCPYVRLADEQWSGTFSRTDVGVVTRNLAKKVLLSHYARLNRRKLSSIRASDHVVGILASGAMTADRLEAALTHASQGTTEIIVHPGLIAACPEEDATEPADTQLACAPMDLRFVSSTARRLEFDALTNPSVATVATRREVHLTSFRELARTPRAA